MDSKDEVRRQKWDKFHINQEISEKNTLEIFRRFLYGHNISLEKFSQSCVKMRCVWKEYLWFEDLRNNCVVIVIVYAKGINREVIKKKNCCCLHQVVNSGIQNNKEF